MIDIRPVEATDVKHLYSLILEAADEAHARAEILSTPEKLFEDGFGAHPLFQALIAWEGSEPVGFTLWFPMYSSWKGKRTLYLEELFIRPFWRKRGAASSLFHQVEETALKTGSNLAWECDRDRLDLRHFFQSMGAIDRASKISFYMEESDMQAHIQDNSKTTSP